MTTQELKSYIDRILGNNIRLLLPSYWWKRAFGAVIDKVDEKVEKSELKTINGESVLGEGDLRVGVKSVESVEDLEKLDARVGDIASVGNGGEYVEVDIHELYKQDSEELEWENLTEIRHIEILDNPITEGYDTITCFFSPQGGDYLTENSVAIQFISQDSSIVCCRTDGINVESIISFNEFNETLAIGGYRFAFALVSPLNKLEQEALDAIITSVFKFYKMRPSTANAYIKGETWTRLLKEGDVTGGGADITIDSELSDTSENAVQNKVITAALGNKADKVEGKQLSTEDFTSALKAKLEGLSNYDDTTLANAISGLETRLNTLVSGDASTAIESFNEIMAFLDGIKDTQDLAGIIASIEQQIATKQDKITDLATIRSNAALGATALQSVPSEYITEAELNAKNYATATQLTAKQDTISDLAAIREGASKGMTALQSYKEGGLEYIAVDGLMDKDGAYWFLPGVNDDDPAHTFAMLSDLQNAGGVSQEDFDTLYDGVVEAEEVTAAALINLNERLNTLSNTVLENEEITASALTQLNRRLAEMEAKLAGFINTL